MSADLPAAFLAAPPAELQGAIQKVRYSHDAMIDMIIANPGVSQNELAAQFGYTPGWVSQVITSDAFQNRLAERKEELVDPLIRQALEERFRALVHRSQELLLERLNSPAKVSDDLLLRSLELGAKALGYGARGPSIQQNTQFVVNLPPKAADGAEWLKGLVAPAPAPEGT